MSTKIILSKLLRVIILFSNQFFQFIRVRFASVLCSCKPCREFILSSLCLIFFLTIISTCNVNAQVNYNQRDDKYTLLGLKRAKELYDAARKEYDRAKELFAKKFIAETEYDKVHASFIDAEVNFQQSLLTVLFENQFVSVEEAIKYQSKEGKKYIRLKIANATSGTEEYRKLLNIDEQLFRSLKPDIINNVYISIANEKNEIVSKPYEVKLSSLVFGKPQQVTFSLLQDLDAVTVNMIFGNGSTRSLRIYLQKDQSKNSVVVQSQQFSQEGELAKTTNYDLTLELFSGTENTFSLEVVNLPEQINRLFRDPTTQARISQFRFIGNINTRKVSLEVTLPDRSNEFLHMDSAIAFYVLVIPVDRMEQFSSRKNKQLTQEQISAMNVGYARLELVPRGKGKMLIKAPQLYYSSKKGKTIESYVEVANEGSGRLDNIELKADAPLNWLKTVSPEVERALEIGQEKRFTVRVTPPDDVAPGRYEVRIRTTAMSDNQPVVVEDKILTIEIEAQANILGTVLLLAFILAIVGGLVYFGMKLSRK